MPADTVNCLLDTCQMAGAHSTKHFIATAHTVAHIRNEISPDVSAL